MATHADHQTPFAPIQYPAVSNNPRPTLPVRSDLNQQSQSDPLLEKPPMPKRMDEPSSPTPVIDAEPRRDDNEEHTDNNNNEYTYNYNRYASNKTIGQVFFLIALFTSNVMQMRTLILQKQRDTIWIASLVLVCVSIIFQCGLAFFLYILGRGDITKRQSQTKLTRYNIVALLIIGIIALINITLNILMLTINPKSFLDTRSLELLQNQN
ncbi:unnamed protein product [Rotaria magnacalcarata]|uniref:Ninjurin 2 n=2 Tax=Rotaria magnacalcarata TaxID=392030 RepID=A0A819NW55_9BILA|nr:unnamed protein product [Rotaria magnacalcarata]CAF4001119.1 unnamed protein product [Rotaria magnacalcarata]